MSFLSLKLSVLSLGDSKICRKVRVGLKKTLMPQPLKVLEFLQKFRYIKNDNMTFASSLISFIISGFLFCFVFCFLFFVFCFCFVLFLFVCLFVCLFCFVLVCFTSLI